MDDQDEAVPRPTIKTVKKTTIPAKPARTTTKQVKQTTSQSKDADDPAGSKFWTKSPAGKLPESNVDFNTDPNQKTKPTDNMETNAKKTETNLTTPNKEDLILNALLKLTEVIMNRENKEVEKENKEEEEKQEMYQKERQKRDNLENEKSRRKDENDANEKAQKHHENYKRINNFSRNIEKDLEELGYKTNQETKDSNSEHNQDNNKKTNVPKNHN